MGIQLVILPTGGILIAGPPVETEIVADALANYPFNVREVPSLDKLVDLRDRLRPADPWANVKPPAIQFLSPLETAKIALDWLADPEYDRLPWALATFRGHGAGPDHDDEADARIIIGYLRAAPR